MKLTENRSPTIIAVAALLLGAVVLAIPAISRSGVAGSYTPENMVRLHVLANSDSPEDQEVKLRVRDAVLRAMMPAVINLPVKDEALRFLFEFQDEIRRTAEKELRKVGKDYPVEVEVGKFRFPAKRVAGGAVPAGQYDAVRVIIGRGQGRNWWCILFPPICFTENLASATGGGTGTRVIRVPEGFEPGLDAGPFILTLEDTEYPMKVRFALSEWFYRTSQGVSRLLSRISLPGGWQ